MMLLNQVTEPFIMSSYQPSTNKTNAGNFKFTPERLTPKILFACPRAPIVLPNHFDN